MNICHKFHPEFSSNGYFFVYYTRTYAKTTDNPATEDMLEGILEHHRGAANAVHLGALGTGWVPGVNVGACQQLLIAPLVYLTYVTDPTGTWVSPNTWVKYQPAFANVPIVTQSAHSDRGRLHLSLRGLSVIEPQPQRFTVAMVVGNTFGNKGTVQRFGVPVVLLK